MKENIKKYILDKRVIVVVYVLLAVGASLQSYFGKKAYQKSGAIYTQYNNYTIFENSFHHLANDQDLYIAYPLEQWDLYKYTPSFSVFFGLFSVMPDWLGLLFWNLFNALILLYAVYYLPSLDSKQKGLFLIIVAVELMTSMQNEQSNGLIAGLIIYTFGFLERNRSFMAAFSVICAVFVKLFGVVGLALFLFYSQKWKSALFVICSSIILFALPLAFVGLDQYWNLYESYFNMLKDDHEASYGYSVLGWIHSWFAFDASKGVVVAIGAFIFLLPFCRIKMYADDRFRNLVLCSVLIWIVIFNHKAESPTFIIAMSGVALWFLQGPRNRLSSVLFVSAFVLTSLSPTDIFPSYLRDTFVKPYVLKAFPCILIWFVVVYDMLTLKAKQPASAHLV